MSSNPGINKLSTHEHFIIIILLYFEYCTQEYYSKSFIVEEQVKKLYQMFQQFKTPSTSSSYRATLARTGNLTAYLILSSSPTWIINSKASDHITENKDIVSSLDSTCSFPSVTLVDSFASSIQGLSDGGRTLKIST